MRPYLAPVARLGLGHAAPAGALGNARAAAFKNEKPTEVDVYQVHVWKAVNVAKTLTRLWVHLVFLIDARHARANAETIIHITELDSGQFQSAIEVSTPWGDYVAIDEGGGLYWVGTYRE